jgi:hypothetical protein
LPRAFHVYPVDDRSGGRPADRHSAGAADAVGDTADGTINHRVGARLEAFARRQAYGTGQPQRGAKAWQRKPVVRRVIER